MLKLSFLHLKLNWFSDNKVIKKVSNMTGFSVFCIDVAVLMIY